MLREPEVSALLLACYQKALGHELPNLLVAAQGIARMLLPDADPEKDALLERLAGAVQKADSLVRRLATLGRTLREPPRCSQVDLADLVHEVAIAVRLTPGTPPAKVLLAPDLPCITTDRERLSQALYQVLRNAHQAGRAELSTVVRVEWDSTTRTLRLSDNGRGLPPRSPDSLTQPFHPANPGQGLGLFTVQVLLASLGGTLSLTSQATGTTVELGLPSPVEPST